MEVSFSKGSTVHGVLLYKYSKCFYKINIIIVGIIEALKWKKQIMYYIFLFLLFVNYRFICITISDLKIACP